MNLALRINSARKTTSMGTKKNIPTPAKLLGYFERYKSHCKNHPRKENHWSNRLEKEVSISKEKPLTWDGFEVWLRRNKIIAKLEDYKANKEGRYSKFADIIHMIDIEIKDDKFTGAVAGIFQHNIIARDLGLSDKQDHSSSDGSMSPTINLNYKGKNINLKEAK